MDASQVKDLGDGRIFTGQQALKIGLVDTLGTFEDAKSIAKCMAGLPQDAGVYEYERGGKFIDMVLGDVNELLGLKRPWMPEGLNYLFTGP
jgi:protease IV